MSKSLPRSHPSESPGGSCKTSYEGRGSLDSPSLRSSNARFAPSFAAWASRGSTTMRFRCSSCHANPFSDPGEGLLDRVVVVGVDDFFGRETVVYRCRDCGHEGRSGHPDLLAKSEA